MKDIINRVDFEKEGGLIPVIAQDSQTNEVLMLAYMNEEALTLTLETNFAHYFSRSKQRIWKKGESSNHTQEIQSIKIDCDNDTILLKIKQNGVACHTGRKSCFFTDLKTDTIEQEVVIDTTQAYGIVETLYHTIQEKKNGDPKLSYTAKLLQGKQNSMLKKIVEEAGEFTFALKDDDSKEIVYEGADLLYHSLVALASKNISPDQIKQEIARRFGLSGIAEKNARIEE